MRLLLFLKPLKGQPLEVVSGNGRLDGHLVQGHVDCIGYVDRIENLGGSFQFYFSYSDPKYVTVEKGSITVNGVSLTVVDSSDLGFSVAIIPFTYENTTFKDLKRGDAVNLEFDVIGKYVSRYLEKEFSRKNKGN
jgi:riboflavin synthase